MPRSRHSRRPSRALRSNVSGLSGTTAISDRSSSGPSTAPTLISPSRTIDDGSPPNRSPSSGPSTAFSYISPSRIIDDGPPPSYRSRGSPGSPSTAIGNDPAAPSATAGSRSIRHMSNQDRPSSRMPSERRHASSRRSGNPTPVLIDRAPSHRAFTPATVAPSVYLGQGGRGPAVTVRPRDSISQVPTRISIRYHPRPRQVPEIYGRYEPSNVVQIIPGGLEGQPITFPRITTKEHARRAMMELDIKACDLEREYENARRAIEPTLGSSEFPRALFENVIKLLDRFTKARLVRDIFVLYHWSLLNEDDRQMYDERHDRRIHRERHAHHQN